MIGGEAGIGKTTLVRTLAREAADAGILVLTGHCYDLSTTPPYGPWLDLAARYVQTDNLPPLPAALVGNGIEEIRSQAALFAEVRAFLAAVATERPTLLVLEDLHWADPSSLELLRHLAVHVQTLPLLLLVTYRIDEPTGHNPFYRQLPALIRDADGLRLDLHRLDVDDLRALVASRWHLPAPEENRLVDYLERHAEGNPLYAKELLRTLEEEGLLRQVGRILGVGRNRPRCPPALSPPGHRGPGGAFGRGDAPAVSDGGRHRPGGAARPLGDRSWGWMRTSCWPIIEHAVEAHLLEAEFVGTRVRFAHALTREALYEGMLAAAASSLASASRRGARGERLSRTLTPWPTTSSKREIRVPRNGWFVPASGRSVPMPG